MPTSKSPYLMMAVLSGVLWGSAGIFVRILGDWGMDGVTIVFSRVLIAVFMMGALILATDRRMFRIEASDLWIFIVCALSMVFLNLFYTISVSGASLSLAAVLLSMSPVFMLLMARALFGERITRRKTGCMLLAIIGCILVSGLLENPGSVSAEGIGAGIAAAFFYAFYGIMSKRAASGGYSTYTILFYCILFSAIVLLPFSDLNAVVEYGSEGLGSIALLVIQALFSSVLPYIFYTVAVTKGEAGTGSLLAACGEPMAAAAFGLAFFTEIPSPLMILGMLLAVVSIAVMCSPDGKNEHPCR